MPASWGYSYTSRTCQQVLPWHTIAADALTADTATRLAPIAAAERIFLSIVLLSPCALARACKHPCRVSVPLASDSFSTLSGTVAGRPHRARRGMSSTSGVGAAAWRKVTRRDKHHEPFRHVHRVWDFQRSTPGT